MMKIIVYNNDVVKAHRVLMKKLNNERLFKELHERQYFKSRAKKAREKHKLAINRYKKDLKAKQEQFLREEDRILIDSKRRAKEYKRQQQNTKRL